MAAKKQKPAPALIGVPPPRKLGLTQVVTIKVAIFRRKGSRFWQALSKHGKQRKRLSTRSTHESSAKEFAELAYRHFAQEAHNNPPSENQPS